MDKKCISCKKLITNQAGATIFMCPSCAKYELMRCENCRRIAAKFVCPNCEFEGPN